MYYPPAWAALGIISFLLTICVAVPAATAIRYDLHSRDIFLGISITVASVVYGIVFYGICTRYLPRLEEAYSGATGLKPAINGPTKEVRRLQKAAYMLLSEMETIRVDMMHSLNSRLSELRRMDQEQQLRQKLLQEQREKQQQ